MNIHDLKLRHFSNQKVNFNLLYSIKEQSNDSYKPKGLWVSVEGNGDGWKNWCEHEDFNTHNLQIEHKVTLQRDPEILLITNETEFDAFNKTYQNSLWKIKMINWREVALLYKGIIITPYLYTRRLGTEKLDCTWYYGWDCASGCIWDVSAILSIEILNKQEFTQM